MNKYIEIARVMNQIASMRADTVFFNANIITMNPLKPRAEAVAVKKGRIIGVGANNEMKQYSGKKTTLIDMNGKTMLPGFIEPHNHFAMYGNMLLGVDCSSESNNSIEDVLEKIRERAKKTPKGSWIQGWGYDDTLIAEKRHLTRKDLDSVAPDHKVFINHVSVHLAYVNTNVLKLANITKDTPNPEGGDILREEDGTPSGVLAEMPAIMPVYKYIPQPSIGELQKGIAVANKIFLKAGVTSINDGGAFGINQLVAYKRAQKKGTLNIRVYADIFVNILEMMEEKGLTLQKLGINSGAGDEWLRMGAAKIVQDGSIQGFTAAVMEPYYTAPDKKGFLTLTQEKLDQLVEKYNNAGFQIQIHGNGDAAIESIIQAYEKALKIHPRKDHRHEIIHCQMVHEDQLARMAELGISANFFPVHVYHWGDRHRDIFIGPERAERIDPLKSAIKHGVLFSMHADTPVTPVSPIMSLYAAVNRLTSSGKVLGEDQRISIQEALEALTINSAKMIFAEHEKGSIEIGKFADFVVISDDPFKIDPIKLKDIKVLKTIVDGEIVYNA